MKTRENQLNISNALKLPPGVRFICSKSALVVGACGLSYGISSLVAPERHIATPSLLKYFSVPLLYVLIVSARNMYRTWSFKRDAKRLGAELMSSVEGKWPGSVDLVIQFARDTKNVYIGTLTSSHDRVQLTLPPL